MSWLKRIMRPRYPEAAKMEDVPASCPYCTHVFTAGRSGEKTVSFPDGDSVRIEIMNKSGVEGRESFTLDVLADFEAGWVDLPISYCPFCGRELKK